MLIAYHEKHEIDGWRHVCTYPANSNLWSKLDRLFIDELIKQNQWVLTCGCSIWQIVKE
jgi:hypothetical protein